MPAVEPGCRVKLLDGPFTGYRATVQSIDQEMQRITVLLRVFGRPTSIMLHSEDVVVVEDEWNDDLP